MKYHIGELSCLSICHQIKVPITMSRLYLLPYDELLCYTLHIQLIHSYDFNILFTSQLITMAAFPLSHNSIFVQLLNVSLVSLRLRQFCSFHVSTSVPSIYLFRFFLFPFFPSGNFIANLQAYTTQTFITFFLIAKRTMADFADADAAVVCDKGINSPKLKIN